MPAALRTTLRTTLLASLLVAAAVAQADLVKPTRGAPITARVWDEGAGEVTFNVYRLLYGRYPPAAVVNYVWDNRLAPGTVLPNAYTDRARMMVLRSGTAEVGRWVAESRDVVDDYRRLFGGDPPRIAGVAIMTDTDNTGERAVAWYDALALRPRE